LIREVSNGVEVVVFYIFLKFNERGVQVRKQGYKKSPKRISF
jgi:hypothetical protein